MDYLTKPAYILFVDDSDDDYELLKRAFKKAEIANELVRCASGEAALDYLKTHTGGAKLPGLILLDLNMPGMGGHTTLQRIKGDAALHTIPVVIFSNSADMGDILKSYQDGANSYVEKPVSFDKLIETIQSIKHYWFETALLPPQEAAGS